MSYTLKFHSKSSYRGGVFIFGFNPFSHHMSDKLVMLYLQLLVTTNLFEKQSEYE